MREKIPEDTKVDFVSDACRKQINEAMRATHNLKEEVAFNEMKVEGELSQILDMLKHNLQLCEKLKHPEPVWTYDRFDPKNEGEKVILKMTYNPSENITDAMLGDKKKYSIAARKLSIIGGMLTMLDKPRYLTDQKENVQALKTYLIREANNAINADATKDTNANKVIGEFVKRIEHEVKDILRLDAPKNITRSIREAERYFIAEFLQNTVLLHVTKMNVADIIQLDIRLNHQLSDNQKQAYMQIHDETKPNWFKDLSDYEQSWLTQNIPTKDDNLPVAQEKWNSFQQLFKSSACAHTPGVSNFRINYLMQQKDESYNIPAEVISCSVKNASPVCYEMTDEAEKAKHTYDNAQQTVKITVDVAQSNFGRLWDEFFDNKPNVPILIQSLLSDKVTLGEAKIQLNQADKKLIRGQRQALEKVITDSQIDKTTVDYHNDGTNTYSRGGKISMQKNETFVRLLTQSTTFLNQVFAQIDKNCNDKDKSLSTDFIKLIGSQKSKPMTYSKELPDFINKVINSNQLNDKQLYSVITILRIGEEYGHEKTKGLIRDNILYKSRNRSEYIIALKKMLVESMGGAVSNNCKSGKDRTGQSEAYQHALSLYYNEILAANSDAHFLRFDEKGERRKNFCELAATINASMKIQEAASANTIGAVGTKSTKFSGLIDDRIREHPHFRVLHDIGCDLAATNKPTNFAKDEAAKTKEHAKGEKKPFVPRIRNIVSRGDSTIAPQIVWTRELVSTAMKKFRSDDDHSWEKFISACLDCENIKPETKFITLLSFKERMEKIDKFAQFNNFDDNESLKIAVACVLKVLSTPNSSKKAFGETAALKQFLDKFNANQITGDVEKVIYHLLDKNENTKLTIQDFTKGERNITDLTNKAMECDLGADFWTKKRDL